MDIGKEIREFDLEPEAPEREYEFGDPAAKPVPQQEPEREPAEIGAVA